jgi:hypothetical protein
MATVPAVLWHWDLLLRDGVLVHDFCVCGVVTMSLIEFAKSELQRVGAFDESGDYGGMLGDAVMKMIEQFSEEGHSGFSASMAISMFERLARFEPLSPLTGKPDEWNEVAEGQWQNRRCSHVFKDADGRAYDMDGRIFREPDGSCFTNSNSRVYIDFPYTPKREYIDVPRSEG